MTLSWLTRRPGRRAGAPSRGVHAFIAETVVAGGRRPNTYEVAPSHPSYVVDAARTRGLDVVELADSRFFYRHGRPVGGIRKFTTTLVGTVAVEVCASKHLTRLLLAAAGVPVPAGTTFAADELEPALTHLAGREGPVVVKPARGRGGSGVTVGVTSPEGLARAWSTALEATNAKDRVVVEDQVNGLDVRAFVVGDRVVAAATRVPAYVVGDGVSTVAQLVAAKLAVRRENAYLARMPIVVDSAHLERSGLHPEAVPAPTEVVTVNDVANLHQGGENIDVTDRLHPGLAALAVAAAHAVPGLAVAGVDLMTPSVTEPAGAVVLEANTSANLSVHHLPAHGEPRDVGGAIVDEMLARAGGPAAR